MDLIPIHYLYIGMAAFLVGFSKSSVGGIGILSVLLMALAIPGKSSPGVLLPMLVFADIMAILFYKRSCQWGLLMKLLPTAALGLAIGFIILHQLPDINFSRIIGWTILTMLALDVFMTNAVRQHMRGYVITSIAGLFAGVASLIANAAGPIFGIYLLQVGLSKSEFIGTRSWLFLIINMAKLPLLTQLGLITTQSLTLNLYFLPVILIGAIAGYKTLKYINISLFMWIIRGLALVAALRLILT
ncbi:MAG TPA: sulfite exporter TauE/SafE family protein [Rhodobacteraceae bacterium]|nr:sulfite exporter TauE/SafE family protein [Paracoccaceae bacterium]